ncbi:MAG: hypothetical protein C5B59_17325 [Bacteroidetes bacterium]|nr:MAG: hypothetical protein C5B59_17325 [Bacteroidota bacterium]
MGAPSVSVPPPTPQQNQDVNNQAKLLAEQTKILTQQFQQEQLLAPFIYQSLGLTPTLNAKGVITGFTQDPNFAALQKQMPELQLELAKSGITNAEQQNKMEAQFMDIQQQQLAFQKQLQPLYQGMLTEQFGLTSELFNREQQALEGKLPVDPGLITSLNEQQAQTEEGLRNNLGPGWATSTPAIQAMSKFNLNKQNILESARRGDLSMAEQLGLAMNPSQFFGSPSAGSFGGMYGAPNFAGQAGGIPGQIAGQFGTLFGNAAQGYNAPLQYWQNLQGMGLQANMANAQNSLGVLGALGGGIGQLAGMGAYGALFGSPITGGGLFG